MQHIPLHYRILAPADMYDTSTKTKAKGATIAVPSKIKIPTGCPLVRERLSSKGCKLH